MLKMYLSRQNFNFLSWPRQMRMINYLYLICIYFICHLNATLNTFVLYIVRVSASLLMNQWCMFSINRHSSIVQTLFIAKTYFYYYFILFKSIAERNIVLVVIFLFRTNPEEETIPPTRSFQVQYLGPM